MWLTVSPALPVSGSRCCQSPLCQAKAQRFRYGKNQKNRRSGDKRLHPPTIGCDFWADLKTNRAPVGGKKQDWAVIEERAA